MFTDYSFLCVSYLLQVQMFLECSGLFSKYDALILLMRMRSLSNFVSLVTSEDIKGGDGNEPTLSSR
jgi:hypothetical protein